MRKSFSRLSTGLALCALLIASCSQFSDIDEIKDVEFEAEYAIPLINSTSSLADLLDSSGEDLSQLTTDNQGNYVFFYEDEGPEKSAEEIFINALSFPFALTDTFVSVPVSLFENVTLEEMKIESGTMQFEFSSQHNSDIHVEVIFPQLVKDGLAFSVAYDILNNGSSPSQLSTDPVSIDGYTLSFDNNQMQMRYIATNENGQKVLLNLVGGIANEWNYEYLKGQWAKDEFGLTVDTLDIDVFEEKFAGDVTFADPKLTIVLENSFGFPVMAQVNSMQMIDEFGQVLALESTLFDDGLYLDYPSITEVNGSKMTTITFDRTNSNIVALLNSQPQRIVYDLAIIINPDEQTGNTGFITDDSKIKATIKTEVPVYGTLSNLMVEEIVETEFGDIEELTNAEFKLIANNGLPLNANLQFYFLDENDVVMDSLFDQAVHPLNAANVDENGDVAQSSKMVSIVPIPADRMQLLKTSKNMKMVAEVSTSNDGTSPVRINHNQNLGIKLGAKFGFKK